MLGILLAGALAFASTNVDDLFVLLVLFAGGIRPRTVVAGQSLGIAALVAVSLATSASALLLRKEWVGLLGIAPFALGAKGLLALRRSEEEQRPQIVGASTWAVAAVTVANGGDNIAVYASLFARRPPREIAAAALVFAVMTALWCVAAYRLVRLPAVASLLARWGHRIAPFVLLALGVYVFIAEGTAAYVLSLLQD